MNICDYTMLIVSIGTKIIYSYKYNDSYYLNMSNYKKLSIYTTSTLIILYQSEIILISLCFIKITEKLVLTGLGSYSSNNLIFFGDI